MVAQYMPQRFSGTPVFTIPTLPSVSKFGGYILVLLRVRLLSRPSFRLIV